MHYQLSYKVETFWPKQAARILPSNNLHVGVLVKLAETQRSNERIYG
jgi:hypothetical protein